jgi:hypothetical protein
MIEAKYANAIPVRNCLHLIVASNDDWVVPAGADERRFFVLDVSGSRRGDFDYFKSLADELENGGAEAMLHELLHRDLSSFNVRDVPQTAGLMDQKVRSLHGFDAWWCEVLADGRCPGIVNDDNIFFGRCGRLGWLHKGGSQLDVRALRSVFQRTKRIPAREQEPAR